MTNLSVLVRRSHGRGHIGGRMPGVIVCDGDSITAGYLLNPPEFYPTVMAASLGAGWTVTNHAVTGWVVQDLLDHTSTVDSQYVAGAQVVFLAGSNDLAASSSSSTILSKLSTYGLGRKAVGFRTIICTITPRGSLDGTQEANRVSVNASLRANLSTYADLLVDLVADSRLADCFDATYYNSGDRLHPTAAGAAVIAELVQATVVT